MAPVSSRGRNAPVTIMPLWIVEEQAKSVKSNPRILSKLNEAFSDASYREMLEATANVNTRIAIERKIRLPFLDQQTNLAQTHSQLSYSRLERLSPRSHGQLVSYPATAWYKKKRQYLANDRLVKLLAAKERGEVIESVESPSVVLVDNVMSLMGSSRALNGSNIIGGLSSVADGSRGALVSGAGGDMHGAHPEDESSRDAAVRVNDESNHSWLREQHDFIDEADYAWEEPESDYDDDRDDSYGPRRSESKRKSGGSKSGGKSSRSGGKKTRGGRGTRSSNAHAEREKDHSSTSSSSKDKDNSNSSTGCGNVAAAAAVSNDEKPYTCEICGAKYKTRPGLSYHYAHTHGCRPGDTPSPGTRSTSPAAVVRDGDSRQGNEPSPLAGLRKFQDNFLSFLKTDKDKNDNPDEPCVSVGSALGPPIGKRQNYCDFCLGSESENKKTNRPEEMVSCADCGRSGHPSCLQFTDGMTANVKKYRWQCIECKTCTLCGTSENDDQLLFCDDCDRGYHMYCLSPPLAEPPEGSWSCHLCQRETTGIAMHTAATGNPQTANTQFPASSHQPVPTAVGGGAK